MNYYNENDPKAAAWLRELIRQNLIPNGTIDERSIRDVRAADLGGFTQCHFFAGIGGWPLALALAGWPEDRPVWTGSCPCQPFSCAGKGMGVKDARHLWPVFRRLVGQRRPAIVFGEQVASADGRLWLAGVRANMARMGYALGSADLCAAGTGTKGWGWILRGNSIAIERLTIGAPHLRQRLWWVAQSAIEQRIKRCGVAGEDARAANHHVAGAGRFGGVANSQSERWNGGSTLPEPTGRAFVENGCAAGGLGEPNGAGRDAGQLASATTGHGCPAEPTSDPCRLGFAIKLGLEGQRGAGVDGDQSGRLGAESHGPVAQASAVGGMAVTIGEQAITADAQRLHAESGGGGAWGHFDILPCRDGKSRRVESGTFPLAHGIPGRVGLLRGYGNAIVPEVGAEFIQAFLEAEAFTAVNNPTER